MPRSALAEQGCSSCNTWRHRFCRLMRSAQIRVICRKTFFILTLQINSVYLI